MPNKLPSRLAVLLGILIKYRYIPTSDAALGSIGSWNISIFN